MSPFSSFCFGLWMLFLHSLPADTGHIQVDCSRQPIIALVGSDVILPCRLDPATSADSMTVMWTRPELDPKYIHVHQDGRLLYESQNPSYSFRTRVFVDELLHGNVSLKMFGVKRSDEGKYRVFIPSIRQDALVQLLVGAVSSPVVTRGEINSSASAVVLQCESGGWYPEPEVLWLDGEGKLLSAGPTVTVRGPDDLYTVSSRVTVEKRHSNNFTCRVQQNNINQSRQVLIHVPDEIPVPSPPHPDVSVIVCLAVGTVLVFAGFFVGWKLKSIEPRDPDTVTVEEGVVAALRNPNTEPVNLEGQINLVLTKTEVDKNQRKHRSPEMQIKKEEAEKQQLTVNSFYQRTNES